MINNLSIAVHAFAIHTLTAFSVDEILLLRYGNWSTNKSVSLSVCEPLLFVFIEVIVSLGRPYASSICSIFPLCMELNSLEKSRNNRVASRFLCTYSFEYSMNSQNLWGCGLISSKSIQIFPKNLLDFRLDTIKKQGFINPSSYSRKCFDL